MGRSQLQGAAACSLYLLCAAALLVRVQGHGFLYSPPARNWLASPRSGRTESQGILTYTPQGGNGKGVCGDSFEGGGGPFSGLAFQQLAPAATYTPGQRVTFALELTAIHGGSFAFQICDRTSNLDHACFTNGRWLTRSDTGERYTYIFSNTQTIYNLDYTLPSDFSCPNGCVLRWMYQTGNTCVMRETVPQGCTSCGAYAQGLNYGTGSGPGLCPVGTTIESGPEVFFNCADVIIKGTTTPPGPSPPPPPSPPIAPSPSPRLAPSPSPSPRLAPSPSPAPLSSPAPTCARVAPMGGQCGAAAGGACCPSGQCCSKWGSCGVSPDHCGANCLSQFGACSISGPSPPPPSPPSIPSPSPSPAPTCARVAARGDQCGAAAGGACCPTGQCCSSSGWCGETTAHCGAGCQSLFSPNTCQAVRAASLEVDGATSAGDTAAGGGADSASDVTPRPVGRVSRNRMSRKARAGAASLAVSSAVSNGAAPVIVVEPAAVVTEAVAASQAAQAASATADVAPVVVATPVEPTVVPPVITPAGVPPVGPPIVPLVEPTVVPVIPPAVGPEVGGGQTSEAQAANTAAEPAAVEAPADVVAAQAANVVSPIAAPQAAAVASTDAGPVAAAVVPAAVEVAAVVAP